MKIRVLIAAVPLVLACSNWTDQVAGPAAVLPPGEASLAAGTQDMSNRYIVVFRDAVQDPDALTDQLVRQFGGTVHFRYGTALKGFAATLPAAAINGLRNNPNVSFIEPDGIVTIVGTDNSATWGLDRIDQRDRPLNGSYSWTPDGSGVTAYIIDTGIRRSHADFGGRASATGYDAVGDGRNGDDCNGHGTHVAGTVGGTEWGVAKNVTLVTVRVLNCQGSGSWSGVIAGVNWVAANATKPAVANMSLGGGFSSSLNTAVNNAVSAGVTFAVAAGNSNANACNYSPASAAAALTVGSTTNTNSDTRSSFSNYGTCLDLFAPGSGITSAWHTTNTATNTISGTSMASPHVAGVAALYLSAYPTATTSAVASAIVNGATAGKVGSAGTGSPNLLLYSLLGSGGGGGTNPPPTASFTFSCIDLTCSFNGSGSTDDGSIASYSWNFGDGTTGSGATTSRTYASAGTRTVTLTVTDDDGATGSQSKSVTTTAPSTGIALSVRAYKVKGVQMADLTWSGASGANVDIFRGTTKVTTANDGSHTDNIGAKGAGSYTYRVCEAGTNVCSGNVTITF